MFHGSGTQGRNCTESIGVHPSAASGLSARPRSQSCQRSQSARNAMMSGAAAPGVLWRATISDNGLTCPVTTTAVSLRPPWMIAPIPKTFSGLDEFIGYPRIVLFDYDVR